MRFFINFVQNFFMDIILVIVAFIVLILGLLGDILPGIPGTPVTYLALLILHWTDKISYSTQFLLIFGMVAVAITILDYVVPVWGTKKFGGTKAGARGSTIGLIVSVVVLPLLGIVIGPFGIVGLLGGPFVGAYIAEKRAGNDDRLAWRSAFGSFLGFVTGTLVKIVFTLVVGFYMVKDVIMLAFN